jgi:hypothetical protein
MIDVETLVQQANPITTEDYADAHSESARRLFEEILSSSSRPITHRHRPLVVASTATVVAVVAASLALSNPFSDTRSAAATELHQLANVASTSTPVVLRSGQYLYSKIQTVQGETFALGSNKPSRQFDITFVETIQRWQASNGTGRELITYNTKPQFTTPASRAGWIASGRPSITPPTNTPSGQLEISLASLGIGKIPNVSALPTNPSALQAAIRGRGKGVPSSVRDNVDNSTTPAGVFGTAAGILETPSVGSSPSLRSALFEVMANVPGVKLLGRVTDRMGRVGIGVAAPQSDGDRTEIIVDAATGQILQTEDVVVDSGKITAGVKKYFGDARGQVFSWTDFFNTGVTNSVGGANTSSKR